MAKQVIQVIGEKLGLPQGIIDMCKMACASAAGMPDSARTSGTQMFSGFAREVAGQFNLGPAETGRMERDFGDMARGSVDNMRPEIDRAVADFRSTSPRRTDGEDQEGQSWLVALAKALGGAMDKKAAQMKTLSDEIAFATKDPKVGSLSGTTDKEKIQAESTKLGGKTTLLQAYGQEMSLLSNAATNVIKSVGEANATNARKG